MKWNIRKLLQLKSYDFEALIAELWSRMGFRTVLTRSTKDGGVDVRAVSITVPETHVAIQAKRYGRGNNVGAPAIRQYASEVLRSDAQVVVVVTTSGFTRDAIEEAAKMNVRLVDGRELLMLLNQHGAVDYIPLPPEVTRERLIARAYASFQVFVGSLKDLRNMQHLPQWVARLLWHNVALLAVLLAVAVLAGQSLLVFVALPFFFVGLAVGLLNILYGRTPVTHGSPADTGEDSVLEASQLRSEAPSRNLRFGFPSLGLAVLLFAVGVALRSFPAIALALPFWLIAIYLYSPASRGVRPRES